MFDHRFCSEEVRTPCYIFDLDGFAGKLAEVKRRLAAEVSLCYSLKANPWLAATAFAHCDYVETCSPGEVEICLKRGGDMSRVIYGGVCKEESDIAYALVNGVEKYSIESVRQLKILNVLAGQNGARPKVLLRVTSGNQFGMETKEAADLLEGGFRGEYGNIEFVGIHYFSGTQRLAVKDVERDFQELRGILEALRGLGVREVEYGAGIGVDYFTAKDNDDVWSVVIDNLNKLGKEYKVAYESGRALAADCGRYITKIIEIRQRGNKQYYLVDGGKHQIEYYSGLFAKMKTPPLHIVGKYPPGEKRDAIIAGALCTVGDVLANLSLLPQAEAGDFVVFEKCGAYAVTENIALFLSRDFPAVYAREKDLTVLWRTNKPVAHLNMPDHCCPVQFPSACRQTPGTQIAPS